MDNNKRFAEIAAAAGDPARAGMLHALLDGRALTASELAQVAGLTPQTASGHLARMVQIGLVSVERQGRHRYHRLASLSVARMMEGVGELASDLEPQQQTAGSRNAALKAARVCYDHLAGQLGVALADGLVKAGFAELTSEGGLFTKSGLGFLNRIGIQTCGFLTANGTTSRRLLCRPCMDWTERRLHIGGAIGAAICSHSFNKGWIRRMDNSRAVSITPSGLRLFREQFGAQIGQR
jgi:DNA-binding transcriptional ArsR family regulator